MKRREFMQRAAAGAAVIAGMPSLANDILRKPIPASGELLPAIGLGTNRYTFGTDQENAGLAAALRAFVYAGGSVVDTAPIYRESEAVLGELLDAAKLRDQVFVATKSDRPANEGGQQRLANSFARLKTKQLDLVQSHNLRGVETMLPVLREAQAEGGIRYVGITTSRVRQFDEFLKVMESQPLDFIQVNYALNDRQSAERILPLARDKGIAVLANIPLGRGRLFRAVQGRTLPAWAREFDCASWAQFFLKYVISHPAITCAIPGMTKANHVVDNFGAALGRLPEPEERRRQEAYIDAL